MKGRAAVAKYTFTDTQILDTEIGWEVMSDWEDPIMVKHAEVVTKNGGDILESGFGMGISATHIQSHDINSHTIIEINDEVYERLLIWAEDKPNVIPVKGDWAESIPTDKKYDAVFYDPYGDMKNKPNFPWLIAPYCKEGAIVSWYNNILRPSSVYSEGYEHHHHYWDNDRISYHEVELEIPEEARIKWYLEGEGNIYYAPEIIMGEQDNRDEFKRIWMGKEVPFKIKCNNNKQDDIYIHMSWTVVKQYFLTGSSDPSWATKQQFWSQLSGSGDTETFSYASETEAWEKAVELQNNDSSGRRYKAVKL